MALEIETTLTEFPQCPRYSSIRPMPRCVCSLMRIPFLKRPAVGFVWPDGFSRMPPSPEPEAGCWLNQRRSGKNSFPQDTDAVVFLYDNQR